MTCGIHLYIEKRNRELKTVWYPCSFRGEFTDIVYGMFAALNNVRNYWNIKPLENRGIPNDLGPLAFDAYYQKIVTEVVDEEHECSIDDITEDDIIVEHNGQRYCNRIWHSANWCTICEMQECYNQVFKNLKDNDYGEWLGLLNYMKAIESNGKYDVRAVFWFDS